jgi:hypothetical protein
MELEFFKEKERSAVRRERWRKKGTWCVSVRCDVIGLQCLVAIYTKIIFFEKKQTDPPVKLFHPSNTFTV